MGTPETSREPCPDRILDDIGGAFGMGAVGGSAFHFLKGLYNAPKGARVVAASQAVRLNAPRVGGSFAVWGASSPPSTAPWSTSARRRTPGTPSSRAPPLAASSPCARVPLPPPALQRSAECSSHSSRVPASCSTRSSVRSSRCLSLSTTVSLPTSCRARPLLRLRGSAGGLTTGRRTSLRPAGERDQGRGRNKINARVYLCGVRAQSSFAIKSVGL
ncbi:hypothetical protein ACSQ67_025244 [Phaseolus vulgaris]